uniref:Ig-like domain-containing protein n=2 Tax=Latimeria chalumnae TaxID=7897 RepID=H3A6C4_LATCH
NVTFSCALTTPKEVLQVTWQKKMQTHENVGTYSKKYGAMITENFKDHFSFTELGLWNSSITLHGATLQDDACYICLFNTYPEGSVMNEICFHVYVCAEPKLEYKTGSKQLIATCFATGKPTPHISWNTNKGRVWKNETKTSNGTANVLSKLVLNETD